MLVIDVTLLLAPPDELADDELDEVLELLQPEMTADAITTPATQPGSTSLGFI
ncbi:MAG: hypothetical protein ACRDOI_06925 [Trebonia sp.]